MRRRMTYWINRWLADNDRTVTWLAARIRAPRSTVAGWLDRDGKAAVPMTYLAPLSAAMGLQPRWFAELRPVPDDPFEGYGLPADDPLRLLALPDDLVDPDEGERAAAALGQEDEEREAAGDRRAAPPSRGATGRRGTGGPR
jgi:hypothetical protein